MRQGFRNVKFILKLVHNFKPGYIALTFLYTFTLYALGTVYSLVFLRRILNAFESGAPFMEALVLIIIFTVFNIITDCFRNWYAHIYQPVALEELRKKITAEIYQKAAAIDLVNYEDPDYYDEYYKVLSEVDSKLYSFVQQVAGILCIVFAMTFNLVFVVTREPVILLFVAIISFSVYFLDKRYNETNKKYESERLYFLRKQDYAKRLMYEQRYAAEIRITDIKNAILDLFSGASEKLRRIIAEYGPKKAFLNILRSLLSELFILFISLVKIVHSYIYKKSFMIGDMMSLLYAASNLTRYVKNVLVHMMEIYNNMVFIENLSSFLRQKPHIELNREGEIPESACCHLQVKNVSFRYRNKKEYALRNVSLDIPHGNKIAIVGPNGSGKTSLVKLLLRLYETGEGQILLNGKDIRTYQLEKYRELFGIVWQEYKIYGVSIAENIMQDTVREEDMGKVNEVLELVDLSAKVSQLRKGANTVLSAEFDPNGVGLSGGQNQRLAIGRSLVKTSPIYIWDEPTSNLDPKAEQLIFANMMEKAGESTVILITHKLRLASAMDQIYVMESGRIVESGTHQELMASGGLYAAMYNRQKEKFRECASAL